MPPRPPLARAALALAAAAAPLAGCGVDPAAPAVTFSGTLAGQPFAATASAVLVRGAAGGGGDTLYVYATGPSRRIDRQVSVRLRLAPFTGAGRYPLGAGDAALYEVVGGDAFSVGYASGETGAGVAVVERYDGPGGPVAGTVEFTAASAAATVDQPGMFGRTVRLASGRFRAESYLAPYRSP